MPPHTPTPLPPDFFVRDALVVAPELLGKILVGPNGAALRITEVEVYRGTDDTACHARMGKTARNSVMWSRGGHLYVYLCYGIHRLLNIVTGGEDSPQAVLIRAGSDPKTSERASGPGVFTKRLGITTAHSGLYLPDIELPSLLDDGFTCEHTTSPRVGIDHAAELDRLRPWRFISK